MKHKAYSPEPWKWQPEGSFILDANDNQVAEIPCQGCELRNGPLLADAPRLAAQEELGLKLAEAVLDVGTLDWATERIEPKHWAKVVSLARAFKEEAANA